MAYLVAKLLVAFLVVSSVAALQSHHQDDVPTDNLGTYKSQSCCPDGYFPAG